MKASDLFGANVEPIPGLPYTQEVVNACQQRAGAMRDLEAHPGWQLLQRVWRKWRAENRMQAQGANDPAEWRQIVAMTNALSAVEDIVAEYEALAAYMEKNPTPERVPYPRGDFADETADAAVRDADMLRDMARLPGWAVFIGDIGARVRALASVLTQCSESERVVIRGAMGALTTAMAAPKQILDLGADAEAWQQARLEELARKERSGRDA